MGSDNFKRPGGLKRFVQKHRQLVTIIISICFVLCGVMTYPKEKLYNSKAPSIHDGEVDVNGKAFDFHASQSELASTASDYLLSAAQTTRSKVLAGSSAFMTSIGYGTVYPRVTVTLTTIPDRIHFLQDTLDTLLAQTRLPDEIVINVPRYSRRFKNEQQENIPYAIPDWLKAKGVEVFGGDGATGGMPGSHGVTSQGNVDIGISGWGNSRNLRPQQPLHQYPQSPPSVSSKNEEQTTYPTIRPMGATIVINRIDTDHGPASKFIPTITRELRAGRWDTFILVADDDVLYPRDWLENLLVFHDTHPEYRGSALGMRGYCNLPGNIWDWRVISQVATRSDEISRPYQVDIITGNNGILVKPYFFLHHPIDITDKTPKSAYYMDDIWINGVLASNNVTKYIIPVQTVPVHSEKVQKSTQTLENVPIGRAYHNNILLKHFEDVWTNCIQYKPAEVPEYFLKYQSDVKKPLNELSNPWAHLGVTDEDNKVKKYSSLDFFKRLQSPGLQALFDAAKKEDKGQEKAPESKEQEESTSKEPKTTKYTTKDIENVKLPGTLEILKVLQREKAASVASTNNNKNDNDALSAVEDEKALQLRQDSFKTLMEALKIMKKDGKI